LGISVHTVLTRYVSVQVRVITGYIANCVIFTIITVIAAVDTDTWQNSFFICMVMSVSVIGVAFSLVAGGLSGLQGWLPGQFSTSMMIGQAMGGLLASLAYILAIISQRNTAVEPSVIKSKAAGYFGAVVVATVVWAVCFTVFLRLPVVSYYLKTNATSSVKHTNSRHRGMWHT
jgi:hypothetical protein